MNEGTAKVEKKLCSENGKKGKYRVEEHTWVGDEYSLVVHVKSGDKEFRTRGTAPKNSQCRYGIADHTLKTKSKKNQEENLE